MAYIIMKIVKPVYDFLRFQGQRGRALNTLKANGRDLLTFWRFLTVKGYLYNQVTPLMIADFIDYLRSGDVDTLSFHKESIRTNQTINRILSTIRTFYQFHSDVQGLGNPILMRDVNRPQDMFKSLLYHAKSDNRTKKSVFKLKESKHAVRLVTDAEMELLFKSLIT